MKRDLWAYLLFFVVNTSFAQSTISGHITERNSGENLIGASVFEVSGRQGTTSNSYGFYSFTLKGDSAKLIFSYVGFEPQTISLHKLKKDTVINIALINSGLMSEVVVSAERAEPIQENSRMSTISLPIGQVKRMPALMGETDVMKVLQLLPGVQAGGEGSSGIYVRGGGQDQNLILLDGVPVYNASHLYGFFSTFNPDAVTHIELIKGGFPARYGGRLSSVVDISMKEGNLNKHHAQVSVGLIASRFLAEGPIKSGKTSFTLSGRRTYLNLLNGPILNKQNNAIADGYYFYDLNGKINHRINEKNRIYLSAYNGLDRAKSDTENTYITPAQIFTSISNSHLQWGNTIAALRWNHIFSNKLFSNFTGTYSKYQFDVQNEVNNTTTYTADNSTHVDYYNYLYKSGIRDFAFKADFDFIINPSHYLRFGANAIAHEFTPGVVAVSSPRDSIPENLGSAKTTANEFSIYAEDDFEISPALKLNAGLHSSAFVVEGKTYHSLQPRLSLRYLIAPQLSLKASYSTMRQFIHLLSNSGLGLPTDLWVPATSLIKPQTAEQTALGFAKTFKDIFEFSAEGYYKSMDNLIEYKDGANFLNSSKDWQTKVEAGRGVSYGTEFFLQKKTGKLSGWIGYTLSKTERQFDNINGGRWFPYRYDRRHDAKISVIYLLGEKIETSATWVFGTGNAVTVPLDWYEGASANNTNALLHGSPVIRYESRNGFRMRSYHRLDLSATYVIKSRLLEHRINVSVYNAYNRKNPYYLEFGFEGNQRALKQVSLFSILPSVTYSIKI